MLVARTGFVTTKNQLAWRPPRSMGNVRPKEDRCSRTATEAMSAAGASFSAAAASVIPPPQDIPNTGQPMVTTSRSTNSFPQTLPAFQLGQPPVPPPQLLPPTRPSYPLWNEWKNPRFFSNQCTLLGSTPASVPRPLPPPSEALPPTGSTSVASPSGDTPPYVPNQRPLHRGRRFHASGLCITHKRSEPYS